MVEQLFAARLQLFVLDINVKYQRQFAELQGVEFNRALLLVGAANENGRDVGDVVALVFEQQHADELEPVLFAVVDVGVGDDQFHIVVALNVGEGLARGR